MTSKDELFQEDLLEEQLDALAQINDQLPTTPTSRAYHSLRQFHAVQVEQEAQALERVRERIASRTAIHTNQQELQSETPIAIVPLPGRAKHLRRTSRLRAFASTFAAILVVVFLVGGFLTIMHTRQTSTGAQQFETGTWHIVPSPNSSQPANSLNSIAFATSNDAWAVGTAENELSQHIPLVEHWDGQRWQIISTPPLNGWASLSNVISIAPDNAWAVGEVTITKTANWGDARKLTLIEHWDGHQWNVVRSPDIGSGSSSLSQLVALNANDIWAVGSYFDSKNGTLPHGLIEHWDGHQWNIIPGASQQKLEELFGIAAISPDDIWAVGMGVAPGQSHLQTLIEHWDGIQWSIVSTPYTSLPNNELTRITAISANDIWAAGFSMPELADPFTTNLVQLFEHWDGHQWSVVANPRFAMTLKNLSDIIAIGANNIWAIGSQNQQNQVKGLIEHWDGQHWSLVSNPNTQEYTTLLAIARDPSTPGKLWIVGSYGPAGEGQDGASTSTLIETNT